jgi:alpha/beta superfamily hydrolase
MQTFLTLLLTITFSQMVNSATISDYAKEARWATQVEDGLMDGEIVWINQGKHKFMAIYTPSEEDSKETVIVAHGIGIHPDWSQVVQPLRVGLTENGFNTLSIQMPVLANDAEGSEYDGLFADAGLRIAASVKYLQKQGLNADILVAHSLGSKMSAHHLANNKTNFKKFIAIGMAKSAANYLEKINTPMLDLYGDKDLEQVIGGTKIKAEKSKHNKNYHQKMISGNHFFDGKDELLLEIVVNWLK